MLCYSDHNRVLGPRVMFNYHRLKNNPEKGKAVNAGNPKVLAYIMLVLETNKCIPARRIHPLTSTASVGTGEVTRAASQRQPESR